jgi:hypothetical protein
MPQPDRFRPQLWSLVYLAIRRVLSLMVLVLRSNESREIEILVLRHELELLRRHQPRPRLGGLNSKIRLINHRGYGHHSAGAVIAMIYLCCGGITIELPTER